MKVPVEIRPLSDGPYPLVPNEGPYVEHEYFECGDPQWCLHEEPPADDEPFYELVPLNSASGLKVFGANKPVQVDQQLPQRLVELGLTERQASKLAIVFHDDIPSRHNEQVMGYTNDSFYVDWYDDKGGCVYPTAVHIRNGLSEQETNAVFWHEIGHQLFALQYGDDRPELSYNNDNKVRRTRLLGWLGLGMGSTGFGSGMAMSLSHLAPDYASVPVGVAGGIIGAAGMLATFRPAGVLWVLSKEEQFCERLARQHKQTPGLHFD